MVAPDVDRALSPWRAHRKRALYLRERHVFAAEVLTCYLALLDVWDGAIGPARTDLAGARASTPAQVVRWATDQVLPQVVAATEVAGPEKLALAARELFEEGQLEHCLTAWLAGGELDPVERYLAQASLRVALVALDADAGTACAGDAARGGERHCPRCGALPQLSFRSGGEDALVSGSRYLLCARCDHSWTYSSSSCPSCGETTGSQRTVYAERKDGPIVGRDTAEGRTEGGPRADQPLFAHIRIDACATCERYLIDVDLGRDTRAVPEVDELAALPLHLFATEHGLSKITPNLMGL